MDGYYFDQDKNYLLKTAQEQNKQVLLEKWVLQAIESYIQVNNPMGLVDDFIRTIVNVSHYDTRLISESYDFLAAGYRLKYSSNQLKFLWDGRSHLAVYREEWTTQYNHWIFGLCFNDQVNRAIIKSCVLKQGGITTLLERNLLRIILKQLDLQWDGRRKKLRKAA
ncbi:MAG: hypothetical protein AAGA85_10265 [Bacteroidota bacterium]